MTPSRKSSKDNAGDSSSSKPQSRKNSLINSLTSLLTPKSRRGSVENDAPPVPPIPSSYTVPETRVRCPGDKHDARWICGLSQKCGEASSYAQGGGPDSIFEGAMYCIVCNYIKCNAPECPNRGKWEKRSTMAVPVSGFFDDSTWGSVQSAQRAGPSGSRS